MCRATSARSTPERASPRPADDAPRRDTAAVITVGVDLAAEAAGTAVAVIAWDDARGQVTALVPDATDADVVAAARVADKVGVDCPFGWPTGFVRLVGEHEGGLLAPPASSGRDWRRSLTMRVTDEHVHATDRPDSVERLGRPDRPCSPALGCHRGHPRGCRARCPPRWVGAAGRGVSGRRTAPLAAAAPRLQGLRQPGGPRRLVDSLLATAPWLDLGQQAGLCRTSDHALDAVVCALIARAVALHQTDPAGPHQQVAAVEGWIHVPTAPLEALVGSP